MVSLPTTNGISGGVFLSGTARVFFPGTACSEGVFWSGTDLIWYVSSMCPTNSVDVSADDKVTLRWIIISNCSITFTDSNIAAAVCLYDSETGDDDDVAGDDWAVSIDVTIYYSSFAKQRITDTYLLYVRMCLWHTVIFVRPMHCDNIMFTSPRSPNPIPYKALVIGDGQLQRKDETADWLIDCPSRHL